MPVIKIQWDIWWIVIRKHPSYIHHAVKIVTHWDLNKMADISQTKKIICIFVDKEYGVLLKFMVLYLSFSLWVQLTKSRFWCRYVTATKPLHGLKSIKISDALRLHLSNMNVIFKNSNWYFGEIETFAYGKINERSFSSAPVTNTLWVKASQFKENFTVCSIACSVKVKVNIKAP